MVVLKKIALKNKKVSLEKVQFDLRYQTGTYYLQNNYVHLLLCALGRYASYGTGCHTMRDSMCKITVMVKLF